MAWKFGVRYQDGKVMFFKDTKDGKFEDNPRSPAPDWAIDIREIIAMVFVGLLALCLVLKEQYTYAMFLGTGLMGYATGRTVPFRSNSSRKT